MILKTLHFKYPPPLKCEGWGNSKQVCKYINNLANIRSLNFLKNKKKLTINITFIEALQLEIAVEHHMLLHSYSQDKEQAGRKVLEQAVAVVLELDRLQDNQLQPQEPQLAEQLE